MAKKKKTGPSESELREQLKTPLRDARLAQGEWAYSANPSPAEQAEVTRAREAAAELARRGL